MKSGHANRKGYAVITVMILIIIATGILLFANKENLFFTKISGFFNRSKQIQSVAESGLKLAELDLRTLAQNTLLDDFTSVDVFTSLPGESPQLPLNQGLHIYNVNPSSRTITPRLSRSEGKIDLDLFYFPENPCDGTCSSEAAYNKKMPKFFTIVSQATHQDTGDVFTIESRIQVRLENYAEIAYGVTGVGPYPVNPSRYNFMPSVYGRTHINIPLNKIRFKNQGWIGENSGAAQYVGGGNTSTFLGPVTFEYKDEYTLEGDQDLPFEREATLIAGFSEYMRPELLFTKGLNYTLDLVAESTDTNYNPALDPSTAQYFTSLKSIATGGYGTDLSSLATICQTNSVTGNTEANICLKMDGDEIHRYACNDADPDAGEFFMQPTVDRITPANKASIATYITSFPDRYVGERADVFGGTTSHKVGSSYDSEGVIFCQSSTANCQCNLHIKGIYEGNVTFAADNIVIEGDIVNADQDPINSVHTLGVIAKNNIIIPEGIPQAANSSPLNAWETQNWRNDMTANDPPIDECTTPGAACTPDTLAESYLGITNFIADDGTDYIDRDFGNKDYLPATPWFDHTAAGATTKYYNSPMALDLDGHFIAGETVVLDGIFNPDSTDDPSRGTVVLTCEDPPNCTEYKYREPFADNAVDGNGDPLTSKPLYEEIAANTWAYTEVGSTRVQPVFYADGLEVGGWIGHPGSPSNYNGRLDIGEELPRMKNELIHIFGSLNSKYFFAKSKLNNHDIGFRSKIITDDPRAGVFHPPGFPFTLNVIYDELYRKSHLGKSSLLD